MYLLYLDDSGSPLNRNEAYFVLGGICVPEQSLWWLGKQLDMLAADILPEQPELVEFHAAEMFSARKPPWNRYTSKDERRSIIKNVLHCLKGANDKIVAFACAVHKQSFPHDDVVALAFEELFTRFDGYLDHIYKTTQVSHDGLIICDQHVYAKSLQEMSLQFRKQGTQWKRVNHIREVPFFVDSKASRLIQLADHIAYSVFRRYNAEDLTYFNCIEDRFQSSNGVMHGLVHKQTSNKNCTCPACLSRR